MKNYVKETILLLLSLFVFLISLNNNPRIASLAFNADNLYPAVLYQDLITDGNPLYGWSLTPSPFFFPDIAVYFLIRALVSDSLIAVYGAYVFQVLFLLFAVLYFANGHRKTQTENAELQKTDLNKIILIVYSSFLILFSIHSYFFPVLGFAAHGGALSFSLFCYGLWKRLSIPSTENTENGNPDLDGGFDKTRFVNFASLKFFSNSNERRRFYLWVLFGVFQILLIVSDPLFLLFFNGPFLFLSLDKLRKNRNRFTVLSLSVPFFCALLGLYLYRILTKSDFVFIPTGYYSGTPSWNWIQPIAVTIRSQFTASPFSFAFVLISYPILTFVKFFFGKKPERAQTATILSDAVDRFFFLIASVLISTFGIAVIGGLSGMSQTEGIHLRYLLPFLFFWIPLLADSLFDLTKNYKKGIFFFCYGVFLFLFLLVLLWGNLKPALYQDGLAACFDRISTDREKVRLGRGMSDFWSSRRIRIFSKTNLRADNYMRDLHPEYWQNSWNWFKKTPEHEYNFAVLPGLDEDLLKLEFGEPSFVSSCENYKILIWDDAFPERFRTFRKKKIEEIELWHTLTGRKF
ncbi:hypothetical protein EFP84_14585 [Leptospira kmetyi]|uniref:Uncharacterized protein n=1 Tax=Leptospira kmetyi TaxID=408139 RepID=A0AAD0UPC0_9LEPT|nr:hypothetical protein [Leptospira kmetyi]AYV56600.1 hypothetical protein EFP84_14585 [Leptospira kmetyi]